MIFEFLKKQKEIKVKKKLLITSILALKINTQQKQLYLESIEILDLDGINDLYKGLIQFTEKIEINELEEINEQNFSTIAGLRKKEAIEKKEELNSFSFLINNL